MLSNNILQHLRKLLRICEDIALGIAGAPNCVIGEELFWGEETLDDAIAWALRGR